MVTKDIWAIDFSTPQCTRSQEECELEKSKPRFIGSHILTLDASKQPEMRWRIPQTTPCPSSIPTLFQSLAATPKSLAEAAQIHDQLLVHGLLRSSDPFLATKLVQLYADAGHLPSALHLFDALPHPNIFAWTAVLAALSRSGDHRHCLASYARMRASGVPPDGYALPVVLRSAAQAHLSAPSALHADALKFDSAANIHVRNALIAAYSAAGDPAAARRVFGATAGRNLLSWNSMISGYITVGSLDSALELLHSMESDGCEPDIVTRNIMMDGYCRAGRCDEALKILRRTPEPSVVSWTTLILGYSRCGNHEAALALFRRMMSRGLVPPDQDTLSCVLSSCRHVADPGAAAREVHAYGLKALTPAAFYSSAGAALLAFYATSGNILAARLVFDVMDPADVVTWNAAILGFVHAGMSSAALEYFSDMVSRGIRSDSTTIATVLPVCDVRHGRQIHAHAVRYYYGSATPVSNALISMYSRSGCIVAARSVFSSVASRDVVSWNAMIGAYGSHGMGGPAVDLVDEMVRSGVRPNLVTLTSALTACSHCGLVDEGLELFDVLGRELGLVPTMEQYACVVDLLGRAGKFEEAVRFIRRMPMRADGSVWGALLAASRGHYEGEEYGRVAFEELARLEPENTGNYVTMSGIYARVGRWEEAKMVRKLMERRGLAKPSGYSWIEGMKE